MKNSVILLLLIDVVSTTKALHEASLLYLCSESGDAEVGVLWDSDPVLHADFKKEEAVWQAPLLNIDNIVWPEFYATAQISRDRVCGHYLPNALKGDQSPARAKAPQVFIYPKDAAEPGRDNTLLCYIRGYYPPALNVTWTRNGVAITDGVALSHLWLESDGTFSRLASLAFRPHVHDVYNCKVDHAASRQTASANLRHQEAATVWVMEGRTTWFGPTVLCGVGFILGSFFLTIGITLFAKGSRFLPLS